jgi:hypothetical protein
MRRNSAPTLKRLDQAVNGRLQLWRVVAYVAGFPEHLINDGVERDDTPDEIAALGLPVSTGPGIARAATNPVRSVR